MSTIGKVRAVFTANAAGLTSGVNAAAASMRKMESSVASLRSGMNALVAIQGAQFFGGMVSAAGGYVRSLISMGQAEADAIGRQKDLAAQVGMSYSELAGLGHLAEITGVGIESVATAATRADVALVRAQGGSRQAQAAFAGLGLDVSELAAMNPADRFNAIAEAIANIPDPAARSAAAVALFGRSGASLLPMFEDGAAGIAAARDEAERLGLALTTAQVSDVDQMGDSFARAEQAVSGVVGQVVSYLAPAVTQVADAFTNMVGSVGGANIGQAIGDGILQGARFLAGVGDWLIANLTKVWEYVSQIGISWADTFKFAGTVASFFAMVGRGWLTVFLTVVRVAIAPAATLIEVAAGLASLIPGMKDEAAAALAASQGLRGAIDGAIAYNATAAAENFNSMIAGEAPAFGEAAAGPLVTLFDEAAARARASAGAIDEAGQGAADGIVDAVASATAPALKGVDSRSAEGVSEMFRLMRGGDGVQERQLAVLETIAENTAGGDESYPFAFE